MTYKQKLLGRTSNKAPKELVCAPLIFFLFLPAWNVYVMAGPPEAIL